MQARRTFIVLASLTALLLLFLIMMGTLVRLTNAETACNRTWPLCDGNLLPPLNDQLAWIDWGHRLSTVLVGGFVVGLFILTRRYFHHQRDITLLMNGVMGLFVVQSLLGAATMTTDSITALPLVHLSLTVIMLSCLVAAMTSLLYAPHRITPPSDNLPQAIHGATLMTFLVLMTGALIIGQGASQACGEWPLCSDLNTEGRLINAVHRGSVLLLGILLVTILWRVRTERPQDRSATLGITLLLGLYLLQSLVGALYVLSGFHQTWSTLHVILAGVTWAAAVSLSMMMSKQQQLFQEMELQ